LGFFVVITSVMEQSFPDYFMTPFHTENLTGSAITDCFRWFIPLWLNSYGPLRTLNLPANAGQRRKCIRLPFANYIASVIRASEVRNQFVNWKTPCVVTMEFEQVVISVRDKLSETFLKVLIIVHVEHCTHIRGPFIRAV
jgi:hypothetical protein